MTTIGILGGGQLGRMLALVGYPLGARFRFLDPAPDAPMRFLAEQVCAHYDDVNALEQFADELDVVTYEFENVPVTSAHYLQERVTIFPPADALRVAQDRYEEKSFFNSLGIPTPRFTRVNSLLELESAIEQIHLPAVLKTRRFGYDGKGQFVIETQSDAERAWQSIGSGSCILEEWIDFTRELSLLAVRNREGARAFYPLVENHHREGILRLSLAPAPNLFSALQAQAEDYAERVLDALNYVGVIAIEWFQVGERLLANELAPRVHNSGHWTMEGAATSQFENHLRAILGLPLGAVTTRGHSAMMNLIGELPDLNALLQIPGAHLHLYDKAPRPGRKLGHVTIVERNEETRNERLEQVAKIINRESTRTGMALRREISRKDGSK